MSAVRTWHRIFRRVAVVAATALSGCSAEFPETFKARGTHYKFPTADIVGVTTTPHRLIRLSPGDEPFDLVFDSRIDDQVDRRGFQKVFSINDGPLFAKSYTSTPVGVVACRPSIASMECGVALSIGGEHWSLLFAPALKPEVVAIEQRARAYIRSHQIVTSHDR